MFNVIMRGLWDIQYAVIKGVSFDKADELFDYVTKTCSEDYFHELFIHEVNIESNGEIIKSMTV